MNRDQTPTTPSLFDHPIPDPEPLGRLVHGDGLSTSVEAARAILDHRSALQQQVLAAVKRLGPVTDERLETLPEFAGYAASTIRKRRSELFEKGVLVIAGETRNSRGRTMKVWALAEAR